MAFFVLNYHFKGTALRAITELEGEKIIAETGELIKRVIL